MLPKGTQPLAAYARYYSGVIIQGHRLVEGYYLARLGGPPGIYLKPFDGGIADGGCDVVTVFFDPKAGRMAGAFCNGLG